YQRPEGVDTYDVFTSTALALAQGVEPPAPCDRLWDGLEAFAAYGDELASATNGRRAAAPRRSSTPSSRNSTILEVANRLTDGYPPRERGQDDGCSSS